MSSQFKVSSVGSYSQFRPYRLEIEIENQEADDVLWQVVLSEGLAPQLYPESTTRQSDMRELFSRIRTEMIKQAKA